MKKHNKLKVTNLEDKGLTKCDWAGLFLLVLFCILTAIAVFTFIAVGLKVFTEAL